VKKLGHGRGIFGRGHPNGCRRAIPQDQPAKVRRVLIRGRYV
jgi:hypothetical protein